MPRIEGEEEIPFSPYWQTTDDTTVRLYLGNVTDVLAQLPPRSVQCCITSPPYWGLRAYATGTSKHHEIGSEPSPDCGTQGQAQCGRCFVCAMVAVFRGVHRVLRNDGTLWLNLGDTYSGGKTGRDDNDPEMRANLDRHGHGGGTKLQSAGNDGIQRRPVRPQGVTSQRIGRSNVGHQAGNAKAGLSSGNLVGVPWRVALALQADGWVLRQDIIWRKLSPMPESVRNRCTKAHEYVFLLTKGQRYFYNAEAIKERSTPGSSVTSEKSLSNRQAVGAGVSPSGNGKPGTVWSWGNTSNKRSVWSVSSQGYSGAHFATFPQKLIEPMILAGTSERGACAECGTPWVRVTEEQTLTRERPNDYVKRTGAEGTGNRCANTVAGVEVKTVGWRPGCECNGRLEKRKVVTPKSTARYTGGDRNAEGDAGASLREEGERGTTVIDYISDLPLDNHPVLPCVVLDPFIGSGTTAIVAVEHGRSCWGIDLSEQYLRENAVPRIEGQLLSIPVTRDLVPEK